MHKQFPSKTNWWQKTPTLSVFYFPYPILLANFRRQHTWSNEKKISATLINKKECKKKMIKNYSWIFAYMMFSETTAAPHWTMIVSKYSRKLTVNKWTSGGKWTSMKYKANAQEWPQKPLSKKCEIYLGLMESVCIKANLCTNRGTAAPSS